MNIKVAAFTVSEKSINTVVRVNVPVNGPDTLVRIPERQRMRPRPVANLDVPNISSVVTDIQVIIIPFEIPVKKYSMILPEKQIGITVIPLKIAQ